MSQQKIVIVIAPSGGGKSTFRQKCLEDIPLLRTTTSYTTRKIRTGEVEGEAYHFVSLEKFKELENEGFFVELASVHDNFYGTPKIQIEEICASGKHVIMDVDIQGADSLKKYYPHALTVFILPPSIDELRRRVISREGKEPDDLELRMQTAAKEIARASDFDAQVVNDEFDSSYAKFKKIVEEYIEKT